MYRITAIICSAFLAVSSMVNAAFVPSLPYMPPADVQLFDLIYNAYGVTSPVTEISDSAKRMQAYLDLYSRVLGQSNQAFLEDIREVFDNAKTSRKLVLTQTISQQLQQGMKEALNSGIMIPSDAVQPTTKAQFIQRFKELGIVNPEILLDRLWQYYGVNTGYFVYSSIQIEPNPWVIVIAFQGSPSSMIAYTMNGSSITISQGQATSSNVKLNTFNATQSNGKYTIQGYRGESSRTLPMTWSKNTGLHANLAVAMEYAGVTAQNTAVRSAIDNTTLHPITRYTKVENGVIDDTAPIAIDLPRTLPKGKDTVQGVEENQEELGVVPISENPAQTISELSEEALAKYGDTSDYALDLTRYFPFCLPFDVARILQAFVAEPEAPSFSYTINNPFSEDTEDDIVLEIDLSQFNDVAAILRTLESIAFVVGLAVVTRSLYLRG